MIYIGNDEVLVHSETVATLADFEQSQQPVEVDFSDMLEADGVPAGYLTNTELDALADALYGEAETDDQQAYENWQAEQEREAAARAYYVDLFNPCDLY